MKLEIKEFLQQLTFPETTMMSPPPRKVPTKGQEKSGHFGVLGKNYID